MSPGAQNMKTGHDALGSAQNWFGSAEHENGNRRRRYRQKRVREHKTRKRDPSPSVPPKLSPGAHNIKTGPNAVGTAENGSGSAEHENGTSRPRYCRKRVRERKTYKRETALSIPPKMGKGAQIMKTGPNAVGTAENGSGGAKHENGT
jgi:hypothetical protein